jgi:hypothetical protein
MALLSDGTSVQAEKAEDEQDDDHQADEVDDAVHGGHLLCNNPSKDCAGSDYLF